MVLVNLLARAGTKGADVENGLVNIQWEGEGGKREKRKKEREGSGWDELKGALTQAHYV